LSCALEKYSVQGLYLKEIYMLFFVVFTYTLHNNSDPLSSINFFYIGLGNSYMWAYIDTQTYTVSKPLLNTTLFILKGEKVQYHYIRVQRSVKQNHSKGCSSVAHLVAHCSRSLSGTLSGTLFSFPQWHT
jgi:hypothetical protein